MCWVKCLHIATSIKLEYSTPTLDHSPSCQIGHCTSSLQLCALDGLSPWQCSGSARICTRPSRICRQMTARAWTPRPQVDEHSDHSSACQLQTNTTYYTLEMFWCMPAANKTPQHSKCFCLCTFSESE